METLGHSVPKNLLFQFDSCVTPTIHKLPWSEVLYLQIPTTHHHVLLRTCVLMVLFPSLYLRSTLPVRTAAIIRRFCGITSKIK
ncbi:hypothetical protein GOODEAATRI_006664 [Goodea atripinnis]|uniref:Uncharacterized protein n=1 Tax=Goodea atripinnis TaxID=208336 RepID=A0ABV0NI44_9TELE